MYESFALTEEALSCQHHLFLSSSAMSASSEPHTPHTNLSPSQYPPHLENVFSSSWNSASKMIHLIPTSSPHLPRIIPTSSPHNPHIIPTSSPHHPHTISTASPHYAHILAASSAHHPHIFLTSSRSLPNHTHIFTLCSHPTHNLARSFPRHLRITRIISTSP